MAKVRTVIVPSVSTSDSSVAVKNQLQLLENEIVSGPSIFGVFAGDGSDGVQIVSVATNFSAIDGSVANYAQYTNLTINNGQTLAIDTGWAFIGVNGKLTIAGIISADGQGESGGAATTAYGGAGTRADGVGDTTSDAAATRKGVTFANNTSFPVSDATIGTQQHPIFGCLSGAGGGGGASAGEDGGAGGGAGSFGGAGGSGAVGDNAIATPTNKIKAFTGGSAGDNITHGYSHNIFLITAYRGAGGGAGGDTNPTGGKGGGVIYIECNELVLTGTLTADGANGADGVGGNDGGGGGGGAGIIIIRAKIITTNAGIVTVAGGAGGTKWGVGTGKNGGDGAIGFKEIILVQ